MSRGPGILGSKSLPRNPNRDLKLRKSARDSRRVAERNALGLKIVVRRLPPNLPEQIFWQSVQTWVTDETIPWKEFCPGNVKK